jgi:hypothetical protein
MGAIQIWHKYNAPLSIAHSSGIMKPGREANLSPQSHAKVKKCGVTLPLPRMSYGARDVFVFLTLTYF